MEPACLSLGSNLGRRRDNLRRALEAGKGAIICSAHLGNWEWGGVLIARLGFPISAITWVHEDRRVNNFFVRQRTMGGVRSIPLGGSVRTVSYTHLTLPTN